MKISYRILLINFAIVVLITASSAVAFYSIMYNALTSQRSQYLVKSANDFIYSYSEMIQETEDDFQLFIKNSPGVSSFQNQQNLDFVFKENKSTQLLTGWYFKDNISLTGKDFSLDDFFKDNPHTIVKKYSDDKGNLYYGRILSGDFLNELSKKINADVAVISNNSPIEISNKDKNQNYVFNLSEAYKELKVKNNFELYTESPEGVDFVATIIKNSTASEINSGIEFVIFNTVGESVDLRSNLKSILMIIGIAGVLLSLILTFIFSDRIRKQLTQLSRATEITKEGNLKNRITIKSKDEIGDLARAFNNMLDDLERNQRSKEEYSEFITLINQNPTLKEISEAALYKIIKTCSLSVGALYLVDNEGFSLLSSYGLKEEQTNNGKSELYNQAIKNRETIEINSGENLPVVNTGALSISIRSLLVVPILYNNKVIAILELGGFDKPSHEAREYLSSIQEQLAIGLTNATALVQLEDFVTELKRLNDEYQKQNEQITKQNAKLVELHKELKDKADELAVQKEKAEESTHMKSQFLANMSHELRTPMNSILGLTELILESSSLKGKNKERLEVVLKSGKRLMNLINDILDLSKIEAGKMEMREEISLLDELIEDVENATKPLTLHKNIEFRITKKINTHIKISTDKGRVTQVLINLLGNAVKFTEKGFVELAVSADSDMLTFDVTDSGIGLSQNDIKIIFEEFRQVDGTTTRKYGGTGLGLTICRKIADVLGGSISVESELNKGSVFTFKIPLKVVEFRSEKPEDPKVNVETLIKNRRHPILIIDDDPEIRYTIGQYLISRGYEVVYAEDGEQGLEKAAKIQPFAITLDVMLPKKDGWNILKEFKENPATRDIPVILISVMGDKNLGYGLGAFEYFIKPISSEKLLSAFSRLENLAKKRIEKIVIVDDDEMEFEKFNSAFKNDKVRIEYIKDSSLAYNKILEIQPDLIILDLLMPNMDGISLSHKLKSSKETRHIPVIISTAKDLTEEEKISLNNTVEEITVKSKGHPLDVLKIVRDRIKLHEDYSMQADTTIEFKEEEDIEEILEANHKSEAEESPEYKALVLLVDDDSDTLFTVNEIVQSCGCKTLLANSGQECLDVLENETPDLILMDIMMPGMDGFQTLKNIKKNIKWSNIPVFAVTAKAMVGDKEIIIKNGFDDYIPKPVNAVSMAFKIEKLFTKIRLSQ